MFIISQNLVQIRNFLRYPGNRQTTNRQTDRQTVVSQYLHPTLLTKIIIKLTESLPGLQMCCQNQRRH